jgi:hypothetical protein
MTALKGIDQAALAKLQGTTAPTSWDLAGFSTWEAFKNTLKVSCTLGFIVAYQKYTTPSFDRLVSQFAVAAIKANDLQVTTAQVVLPWGKTPGAIKRQAETERADLAQKLADRVSAVISKEQETDTVKKVVSTFKALIKDKISEHNKDTAVINAEVASVIAAIAKKEVETRFADPLTLAKTESVTKAAQSMLARLETSGLVPTNAAGMKLINVTIQAKVKNESQTKINMVDAALKGNTYRFRQAASAGETLVQTAKTIAQGMVTTDKDIVTKKKEITANGKKITGFETELNHYRTAQARLMNHLKGARTETARDELTKELEEVSTVISTAFTNHTDAVKAGMKLNTELQGLEGTRNKHAVEWNEKCNNKGIKLAAFNAYKADYTAKGKEANENLLVVNDTIVTGEIQAESVADANYLSGLYTAADIV